MNLEERIYDNEQQIKLLKWAVNNLITIIEKLNKHVQNTDIQQDKTNV